MINMRLFICNIMCLILTVKLHYQERVLLIFILCLIFIGNIRMMGEVFSYYFSFPDVHEKNIYFTYNKPFNYWYVKWNGAQTRNPCY